MAVLTVELAGRRAFALLLVSVRRPDSESPVERRKDIVAILTALEGHKGASFTLQWSSDPRIGDPSGGSIEVSALVSVPAGLPADRLEELADDVLDLLNGPPNLWRFRLVEDSETLGRLIEPIDAKHLAEIARREEELPADRGSPGVGFSSVPAPDEEHRLWTLWTLGPPAPDTTRLAAGLLSQEAPVVVRMTVQPSALTDSERDAMEDLIQEEAPHPESSASYRAAYRTFESLLYPRPLFEARCVIASPDRLSPSLLSTVGQSVSEPAQHVGEVPPVLAGGYAIDDNQERLSEVFGSLGAGQGLESLAPSGLQRLRSLLGVWEAANLFRLPVLDENDTQGLAVNERPILPGVLRSLPAEGTRVGELAELPGRPVAIAPADRFRHTYVVGQTGTGKSTLLLNMALDDIKAGHGVCVVDPHGDLVEAVLGRLPRERIDDVVLVDPGDPVAVVGMNLIEAESEIQRNYLLSELSAMMYSLFDPKRQGIVGPRFETMMRQAILLLQTQDQVKASILDVPTVFADEAVRTFLLNAAQARDPSVAEYWQTEGASRRSNEWGEVQAWFRSKFDVFSTSRLTRSVVGQAESTVSFAEVLREQKILLINLSKGSLGEYNSALLGHVATMKLWGAILERSLVPKPERHPFFVYIDEFQNITTESLGTMLAEARKYNVGLTLANQFFEQLTFDTRAALLGNVGSKLAFRLGPTDAEAFAEWLGGGVDADELAHLANYETVAALSPSGMPTSPALVRTFAPGAEDPELASAVREASRQRYGTPLEVADERFKRRWAGVAGSFAAKTFGAAQSMPSAPSRPRAGSFLDKWLADRQNRPPIRWDWLDDWIESRLKKRAILDPGPESLIRLTGTPQLSSERIVQLAERAGVEQETLRPALQPNAAGFLVFPRAVAALVALHAGALGFGAELLGGNRLVTTDVPGQVPLRVLALPEIVCQRLSVRSVHSVQELRDLPADAIQALDLPDLLRVELRILRGEAPPMTEWAGTTERIGADVLGQLPSEDMNDLIRVCEERVAEQSVLALADAGFVATEDGYEATDADEPVDGDPGRLAAALRRAQLDSVRAAVRSRYPRIVELLGG